MEAVWSIAAAAAISITAALASFVFARRMGLTAVQRQFADIQQRTSGETDRLVDVLKDRLDIVERENTELRDEVKTLEQENIELRKRVARLERAIADKAMDGDGA